MSDEANDDVDDDPSFDFDALRPHLRELQMLQRLSERTGHENGVTLLVHGALVTGFVTASQRMVEWFQSTAELSQIAGSPMPAQESTAPTEEQRAKTAVAWDALVQHGKAPREFTTVSLRAVQVNQGAGRVYHLAYMRIHLDSVDGFTFGLSTFPGPTFPG